MCASGDCRKKNRRRRNEKRGKNSKSKLALKEEAGSN
jgi:hypothetical protein